MTISSTDSSSGSESEFQRVSINNAQKQKKYRLKNKRAKMIKIDNESIDESASTTFNIESSEKFHINDIAHSCLFNLTSNATLIENTQDTDESEISNYMDGDYYF